MTSSVERLTVPPASLSGSSESASGSGGSPSRFPSMPAPDGRSGRYRVLVVDRDPASRRATARALQNRGHAADTAETTAAALDLMRARPTDAVVLHDETPERDRVATLAHVRARYPEIEVVLLVPHADPPAASAGLAAGAHSVLAAPVEDLEVLVALAERAAQRTRLTALAHKLEERLAEHENLGEIITGAAAMLELLRRATAAAASTAPVLVMGETGTGKSLLARTIHRRSSRLRAPLVVWSPAAVPADLAAVELHAALDEASGGTLLLEDFGDLPPVAQSILATELTKRGREAPRVIATATPELRERIERGEFRKELFYGLAAVLLEVPPLRRRRDDVPLLAYHFLARFAAREGKTLRRIGPEALRLLRDGTWPGNVGELRTAIEHAVVMARTESILPVDLPQPARPDDHHAPVRVELASPEILELPYAESKERAIAEFDRTYVERCLRIAGGNVSEAARLAGMDRSNFRRILKKAGRRTRSKKR